MIKGLVEGLLGGHQKKVESYKFTELESSPLLFSSDYLSDLYKEGNKKEKEQIYDHMLRHAAIDEEYDGYMNLASNIENDLWRDW